MSRKDRLRSLLTNPHVWQPGHRAEQRRVVPSGFAELDRYLGGGWPLGVLTEILLSEQGIGELRLLMPALLALDQPESLAPEARAALGSRRQVCWLMPPYIPYAPALVQQQLDLSRILIVNAERHSDGLWAMEQALRSQACAAVLGWFANIEQRALRRLQLAAEAGACWAVIFRHSRFGAERPTAPLRLRLVARAAAPHANEVRDTSGVFAERRYASPATVAPLDITILRNRYGPAGSLSLTC